MKENKRNLFPGKLKLYYPSRSCRSSNTDYYFLSFFILYL